MDPGKRGSLGREVFEMKARKFNFKTRRYTEYELPQFAKMYTPNMNEFIPCAQCGKRIRYGDSYTSLQIHNEMGLAYPVCHECYDKEWKERSEANE